MAVNTVMTLLLSICAGRGLTLLVGPPDASMTSERGRLLDWSPHVSRAPFVPAVNGYNVACDIWHGKEARRNSGGPAWGGLGGPSLPQR